MIKPKASGPDVSAQTMGHRRLNSDLDRSLEMVREAPRWEVNAMGSRGHAKHNHHSHGSSRHLLDAYYMPETTLNVSYILSHLILIRVVI